MGIARLSKSLAGTALAVGALLGAEIAHGGLPVDEHLQAHLSRCSQGSRSAGAAQETAQRAVARHDVVLPPRVADVPRQLDVAATGETSTLPLTTCLVGTWDQYSGAIGDVWGDGDYAYLAHYALADGQPARVFIIDISTPGAPTLDEILFIPPPNDDASPQDVKVGDGLLFVALEGDGDDGVAIYDVRDPANRQFLTTVTVGQPPFVYIHNVFYDSGFLYIADSWHNLAIVDLTSFDPDNPPASPITDFKWVLLDVTTDRVHDITVRNGRMYVAGWNKLAIYDVSSVATTMPTLLGSVAGESTHSMWPTDDGQFVVTGEERPGGGIKVYRITDNGGSVTLTLTDSLVLSGTFSVHNQVMVGNRLYNSWYARGLQIFDIDVNGHLQFVAEFDRSDVGLGTWGVYPLLGENRILLSDTEKGLFVVALGAACVCPPSNPPQIETIDLEASNKNRFLSITAGDTGQTQLIRVRFDTNLPPPFDNWGGSTFFAGPPIQICENSGQGKDVNPQDPNACGPADGLLQGWFWAAALLCDEQQAHFMQWATLANHCNGGDLNAHPCTSNDDCPGGSCGVDGVVHLYHEGIVPSHMVTSTGPIDIPAIYEIQVVNTQCDLSNESSYSAPLSVVQSGWGDVVLSVADCPNGPPEESIDVVTDVVAIVDKFSNNYCAPKKTRVDIHPHNVDFKIGITDITSSLGGFMGDDYPFGAGNCYCVDPECTLKQCSGGPDHDSLCTDDSDCSSDPCTLGLSRELGGT